jgi:hypothetical protein
MFLYARYQRYQEHSRRGYDSTGLSSVCFSWVNSNISCFEVKYRREKCRIFNICVWGCIKDICGKNVHMAQLQVMILETKQAKQHTVKIAISGHDGKSHDCYTYLFIDSGTSLLLSHNMLMFPLISVFLCWSVMPWQGVKPMHKW